MRLDYQPDRVFTFHIHILSYNKLHVISLSRPSPQGSQSSPFSKDEAEP